MSRERALNFDKLKTFLRKLQTNGSLTRACLENDQNSVTRDFPPVHSNSKHASYLP